VSFAAAAPAPGQLISGEGVATRNLALYPLTPSSSDSNRAPAACDNGGGCGRCLMLLTPQECPAYLSNYFGCSAGVACPAYVEWYVKSLKLLIDTPLLPLYCCCCSRPLLRGAVSMRCSCICLPLLTVLLWRFGHVARSTFTTEGQLCQPPDGAHCGIGGGTTSKHLATGSSVGPNCGGMYIFRNARVYASPPGPPAPPTPPPPASFITNPIYCPTTIDGVNYQFTGYTDHTDGGALIVGGVTHVAYNSMMNDWRAQGDRLTSVSVGQCEAHCTAQYPCVGFSYRAGSSATTGECRIFLRIDAPVLDLYTPWQSSSFATASTEWLTFFNSRHEAPPCMQSAYPLPQMLMCRGAFTDNSRNTPGPGVNADGGCGGYHHAYMGRGIRHMSCSRRQCAEECENDPACVAFDMSASDYGQCWTRSGIVASAPSSPSPGGGMMNSHTAGSTMVNRRAVERGMIQESDCTWVGVHPPSPPAPPMLPPSVPAPPTSPPPPAPPPPQFTFHTQRLSFADAEAFCVQNGGHLASLHSVAAVDAVNSLRNGQDSWIGLTRSSTDMPWTWSDGSTFGVDSLGPTGATALWNPSGQGNDNVCGRWGWGASGTWDDVTCSERLPFTVRVTLDPGTSGPRNVSPLRCALSLLAQGPPIVLRLRSAKLASTLSQVRCHRHLRRHRRRRRRRHLLRCRHHQPHLL
jgi:hypothetical protein